MGHGVPGTTEKIGYLFADSLPLLKWCVFAEVRVYFGPVVQELPTQRWWSANVQLTGSASLEEEENHVLPRHHKTRNGNRPNVKIMGTPRNLKM